MANRVPGPHPTESFTDNPDVREADVPWDVSPGVAFNGHYTVTVVGTTDGGNGTPQEQTSAAEPFSVDVSPATPANVVVTTDAGQRITHLKWTPNTEPDLLGYDIIRGGPTTPNRVIATVAAPQASYTDDQVATQPAGSYRYWVVAVRQSGTGNGVDQSAPSNEVDATFTTPPKSVSPPPPTTAAPANGSSGPGSASSGTTPSGAGTPGTSAPSSNIVLPPVEGTLPAYQALLNQAQNTTVTTAPPDPGFSSQLPYKPQITRRAITLPPPDTTGALGAVDTPANTGRQTTEYIAAALLLAVLAMFALVLKRSADQAAMLESLAPDSGGLLALGGLGAGRAEIPEDPAEAPGEDGWIEGAREEGAEPAPVEADPAAGAAAALTPVEVAPAAAVPAAAVPAAAGPAAEVARPRRAGGPLMAFDDLLAQTARDPSDPDGARAHRRLKWSERAARLAVALATEHDAAGEEALGDDGGPQDEAVAETADGPGRSFIRGRRRRPELAAPSEIAGAGQAVPVVPSERVPEPLAHGRR
ncbi:MAG TPA: fibronectin type III domain-containing protein, partial [Acidimicrobiales bacterium]